jgi:predicted ATPase/class 3 adenylate cyclase
VSELPIGTVTFLFTDIEGSTRSLRDLGEGYHAVQDLHVDIVREAITAEDGNEVRTEGDAFFAVFRTATHALRAAVRAQRELATANWPHGRGVRVRMGMHTGEGVLGGGDYVGVDVNFAARIAAAGHGGQILISDASRVLVEHTLPEGVAIRGLGTHAVKDFGDQRALFDIVVDGMFCDFPPIRTLAGSAPTNIRPARTSFVGRERELAEIGDLLDRTRLVTLTGPGGTGKTRLALRAAVSELQWFQDGAFVVDLSETTAPALVPSTIAVTLGVRDDPGRDLLAALENHFRGRTMLLVLDNFEQVVEAAPVVGRFLDAAPGLTILATSRVQLHLAGEHEYLVEPLPLPDAAMSDPGALMACGSVRLFVERAGAVRRGSTLDESNAAAVAGIVARLDGLPLALELAASRMNLLSPQGLLDRLEQRLPLLEGGPRDLPDRQRTLWTAIAWSHDLLDDDERRLFARLSVFSGGFSLESAEAVCADGLVRPVIDVLGSLVDNSLVMRADNADGGVRFRMLGTIREFAAKQLDRLPEAGEIQRRHAEHVRALVEAAESEFLSAGSPWLGRLEEEHDNVRAALGWAIEIGDAETGLRIAAAMWRFWQVRNRIAEGTRWLDEILALPTPTARSAFRAKALGARGSLAYFTNDRDSVRAFYEESLDIAREIEDPGTEAEASYNLAFAHMMASELEPGMALLERAIELYGELGDPVRQAHAKTALGIVRMEEGNMEAGKSLTEQSLKTFEEAGDQWGLTWASGQLAAVALRTGDYERGRSMMLRSLDRAEVVGARAWSAVAVEALGVLAIHEGDPERGVKLAGAADRLREVAGGGAPRALITLEDPLELVKTMLPADRIDALWHEGRAMNSAEGVALARSASVG